MVAGRGITREVEVVCVALRPATASFSIHFRSTARQPAEERGGEGEEEREEEQEPCLDYRTIIKE